MIRMISSRKYLLHVALLICCIGTIGVFLYFQRNIFTSSNLIYPSYSCVKVDGESLKWLVRSWEYLWIGDYSQKFPVTKGSLRAWDLIVFKYSGESSKLFVKSIFGIPGNILTTVDSGTGFILTLNSKQVNLANDTPLVYPSYKRAIFDMYQWILSANSYLVLGNNPDESYDSSRFGLISGEQIIGKVIDRGENEDFCKIKKTTLTLGSK